MSVNGQKKRMDRDENMDLKNKSNMFLHKRFKIIYSYRHGHGNEVRKTDWKLWVETDKQTYLEEGWKRISNG